MGQTMSRTNETTNESMKSNQSKNIESSKMTGQSNLNQMPGAAGGFGVTSTTMGGQPGQSNQMLGGNFPARTESEFGKVTGPPNPMTSQNLSNVPQNQSTSSYGNY